MIVRKQGMIELNLSVFHINQGISELQKAQIMPMQKKANEMSVFRMRYSGSKLIFMSFLSD